MADTPQQPARTLACAVCGAGLQAPAGVQWVTCPHCKASNQVAQLQGRTAGEVGASAALAEETRLARLRAQRGLPLIPPHSIQHLYSEGQINRQKVAEAQAAWQQALEELGAAQLDNAAAQDAETRLNVLTAGLCGLMLDGPLAARVEILQSALAATKQPVFRHRLMARLTRLAARGGNLAAAEAWLAHFERQSDDLDLDSAYRSSVAFVAMVKQDYDAVFAAIGWGLDDIPIAGDVDLYCAMIRAQTHEHCGRAELAIDQLVERLLRTRVAEKVLVEWNRTDELFPLAQSLPQARHVLAPVGEATSVSSPGRGSPAGSAAVWALIVAAGIAAIAAAHTVFDEEVIGMLALAVVAVVVVIGMRVLGRLRGASRRWRGELRRLGIAGRARITNMRRLTDVLSVTRIEVDLLISIPGRPRYTATHREIVNHKEFARSMAGSNVAVLVDPQNPARMAIDWT